MISFGSKSVTLSMLIDLLTSSKLVDRRRWSSILDWSHLLTSDLKRCLLFRKCLHWSCLKAVSVPSSSIGGLRGSKRPAILWYRYVWGGGNYDTGMSEGEDIMIPVCLRGRTLWYRYGGGYYDTGMSEGEDIMIPVCLRGRILWYRYVWGGGYDDTGMSEGEDIMIPVCLRGRILWYRYVWGGGYYDTGMSEGEEIMIPVCLS